MSKTVELNEARRMQQGRSSGPRGMASLDVIDPLHWQGAAVPARRWIVPDFVPVGAVTMIGGDGGLGKSILGMMLNTSAATGLKWLGMEVQPVRAVGIHCEDSRDELHIRQDAINRHLGLNFGDLENLKMVSRVGEDNSLMMVDKFNRPTGAGTAFYEQVRRLVQDFGAQLLVMDSLHDLFPGNENSRPEARMFINLLRKIALEIDGAVILLSHPSQAGLSSGTGTSGSTAWANAVRSRLYLTKPRPEEGEREDPDLRVLRTMKSNYGPAAGRIELRYRDGVFLRADAPIGGGIVQKIERANAEAGFLACLDLCIAREMPVSDARNSPRYAPKLFATMAEAGGYRMKELERAMISLFGAGTITVGSIKGPDRKALKVIVRGIK